VPPERSGQLPIRPIEVRSISFRPVADAGTKRPRIASTSVPLRDIR
jgi:hypothetical protein